MKRKRRQHVWTGVLFIVSAILGLITTIAVARTPEPQYWDDAEERNGRLPGKGVNFVKRYRLATQDRYVARVKGKWIAQYSSSSPQAWRRLVMESIEEGKPGDWTQTVPREFMGLLLDDHELYAYVNSYGWPMRSFYVAGASVSPGGQGVTNHRDWTLPSAPGVAVWWPLTVNTVVFAAPWLLILSSVHLIVSAVRRRRRIRRGHCPACNYDRARIAMDAVCPECGKLS